MAIPEVTLEAIQRTIRLVLIIQRLAHLLVGVLVMKEDLHKHHQCPKLQDPLLSREILKLAVDWGSQALSILDQEM